MLQEEGLLCGLWTRDLAADFLEV